MPQRTPDHLPAEEIGSAADALPPRKTPLLLVLSGPSGAGKDAVLQHLRQRCPDVYFAVSCTTRPPRPGEVHGASYHFISPDEFQRLKDQGELLAANRVHGNWYGVPLPQIRRALRAGHDVLLKIDVQGAAEVRVRLPNAVSIFLAPPSFDDLWARLERRRTETPGEMDRRVSDARAEMTQISQYDYVVLNPPGALGEAVSNLECIITAERHRVHRPAIDPQRLDSRWA